MSNRKGRRVHYLSIYNIPKFYKQGRIFSPAGVKMEYVISVLNDIGYKVNFISFANSRKKRICMPRSAKMNPMTRFFLAPYVPIANYTERIMYAWLFAYALFFVRREDIFLVYHTNAMRNDLIEKIVRWKHASFIYEVEEVYTLANEVIDERLVKEEIEFLQCPHKYIFCNPTLGKTVNKRGLDSVICQGDYRSIKNSGKKHDDGKTHCIYAGIIDTVKGGAFKAVQAARYLDESYTIHILGFGNDKDIRQLEAEIESVNKASGASVIYEGKKMGEEYMNFLTSCDIGLSPQAMDGTFNNTSFPSKLFVYLRAGLTAVAPNIEVISNTAVAPVISFYNEDTPQSMANAIKAADAKGGDETRILLDRLDRQFKKDLKKLLED